jgi:PAS domain S-box-containing protein
MSTRDPVNILMVDDQPGKLLSYEAILGQLNENLIKATTAKEALEHLLKTDIAVVLMDVSMPELDGFELAEMIRQHPRFQNTAIIFISAVHLSDVDRLKGYERGAVDYISVPIIPQLLRAKVSVFAELHRKARELAALNRELELRVAERTEELQNRAAALQWVNQELERKNLQLDAIVTTAPGIIFSSRADGVREYVSGRFSEYTGATPASALASGWFEYVHPEDREGVHAKWTECLQSGDKHEAEYRLLGKDGHYRWFQSRAVPIRDADGNIVKWYGISYDIHDSKQLEQSIRDNAAVLERIVDERTTALRRLSGRLMTLQDEERRRVARELHDGLGQELVAAKIALDGMIRQPSAHAKKLLAGEAIEIVDRAIQQVRSVSHLLHPPLLDEVGLLSAVSWYLDGLTKRSGLQTSLEVHPSEFPRLSPDLETAIFRIVQEALTNVFRHSGATRAWVILRQEGNRVVVMVRDDGKGVGDEISELRPGSVGVGIGGMSQRAREFGGVLRVTDVSPGTLVEAVIPLREALVREAHALA